MIRDDDRSDALCDDPVELRDSDVIELVPGLPALPPATAAPRPAVAVSVTGLGDHSPPPRRPLSTAGLIRPIKERDRRTSSISEPPIDRRSR